MNDQLWMRARDELLAAYHASNQPYYATTKPYISSQTFVFDVVNALPAVTPTIAYAVLRKGQEITFFDYGVGSQMPWAPGTANQTKTATDADTNLSQGRRTNGVDDYCIEALSCTHKASRVAYAPGTTAATDQSVIQAFIGNRIVMDPAASMMPAQVQSPFNLEDAISDAIRSVTSISFEWDRERIIKIGRLDEIPEGGAKSFLRASGDPRTDNRYKVPEGYLWRKQGQPDSEFVVIAVVEDDVVVPITLSAPDGGAANAVPLFLYADMTIRLHGMAIRPIGQNV